MYHFKSLQNRSARLVSGIRLMVSGWVLCAGLSLSGQAIDPLPVQAGSMIEVEASTLFDLPPVVEIETTLGNIPVELTPELAPETVANFLRYVDAGLYEDSFIHRSAYLQNGNPFVVQGGGHFFDFSGEPTLVRAVPAFGPVVNEPNVSNVRGTIAMAKLGNDPDSATSQWFFNLGNNGAILDDQNGGFTVFGRVVGDGMTVVDAISNLTRYNLTTQLGAAFGEVPLTDNVIEVSSFVSLTAVQRLNPLVLQAAFPDGGASFFSLSYASGVLTITVSPETPPGDYRMQVEGATQGGTTEVAERIVRISASDPLLWYSEASQIQPAGWRYFEWFKGFKPEGPNWNYHGRHGWLYVIADDTSSMFLWDVALGRWMFTNETIYPWMYAYGADCGWVFFFEGGSPGSRYFKRGDNAQVVSEQDLSVLP